MGNITSTATNTTTYGLYKVPYVSSAININTENLQKCMSIAWSQMDRRNCIVNNVSAIVKNPSEQTKTNVTYYGQGITKTENITTVTQGSGFGSQNPGAVISKTVNSSVQQPSSIPTSTCYESFESDNDGKYDVGIESNKLFCFNGTFAILTIFILILLLFFINTSSKKNNL